jgi:hypothetical protein
MQPEVLLSYAQNSDPELSRTKWNVLTLTYSLKSISILSYTCTKSSECRFSSASCLHCWSHPHLFLLSNNNNWQTVQITKIAIIQTSLPCCYCRHLFKNTSQRGIYGGQSGTGTCFLWELRGFSVSIISPMHHTHSFVYHLHNRILASLNKTVIRKVPKFSAATCSKNISVRARQVLLNQVGL